MSAPTFAPPSYGERLARYSAFFLLLCALAVAALVFYRVRVLALLGGISADLRSGAGLGGYARAAAAADAVATSLVVTLLAAAWALSPLLRAGSVALGLLLAFGYCAFTVLAADFFRVYQAAFGKSFVGGEHFTGIPSMLISAGAELSGVSRAALIALAALLACGTVATLARKTPARPGWALRPMKIAAAAACLVLAAGVLTDCFAVAGPRGVGQGGVGQGGVGPRGGTAPGGGGTAEARGFELGGNPVAALVFGPGRQTFFPAPRAVPAHYNTDSLEAPGASRPVIPVRRGRYNVILWFSESTSWSYSGLAHHGKAVMPVLHELARHGVLLRNHYTNYPLSANTLYSVLSSRYSMYGKAMIFRDYHDVDVDTLPEILARTGYATALIHTGDLLYAGRNRFLAHRDIGTLLLEKDLEQDPRYPRKVGWGADERSMIDPAVRWIEAQSAPWFLVMAPVNPHHPYAIPADVERVADPDQPGIPERERTWRRYLNSLHYTDAVMGSFVQALEREGLMRNTVLVVVGDHGEAFYQHPGNYNHPLFVYEENVHVPALFYSPTLFPRGIEMESVTRHLDIMPSILDLLGISDTGRRDGESIFSPSREKMAVFHTSWIDELMGVRDGRWKYILRVKDSREELYDLQADPGEKVNLAAGRPQVAARYREVAEDAAAYMLEQYRDVPRKRQGPGATASPPR